ncbi:MAG: citryl-CoA lyase [Gemmatimonadetes bacterium]|nr:MAG: citryl-CoA lyase [Gemmatimonadota bacterium]
MVDTWKTEITNIKPNKVMLRGYPIDQLMGNISYAQGVYLALKGELPTENVGKLIDAILVSSIDHGVTPPSAMAAMIAASTGAALNSALAAGILSINRFHGGAIEDCMRAILEVKAYKEEQQCDDATAATAIVANYRAKKVRIAGFGHRIHTEDPRTIKLFRLADELNLAGEFVELGKALEAAISESLGKKLPMNVDGAIAALLCELDFEPDLANAFFIMARVPGLVAHIREEQTRQKPMRRIDPNNWEYDGAEERFL